MADGHARLRRAVLRLRVQKENLMMSGRESKTVRGTKKLLRRYAEKYYPDEAEELLREAKEMEQWTFGNSAI